MKNSRPLAIRTKRLQRAIDRYFSVRAQGGGVFKNGPDKDSICAEIILSANLEGKSATILPGWIEISSKTKSRVFKVPAKTM